MTDRAESAILAGGCFWGVQELLTNSAGNDRLDVARWTLRRGGLGQLPFGRFSAASASPLTALA